MSHRAASLLISAALFAVGCAQESPSTPPPTANAATPAHAPAASSFVERTIAAPARTDAVRPKHPRSKPAKSKPTFGLTGNTNGTAPVVSSPTGCTPAGANFLCTYGQAGDAQSYDSASYQGGTFVQSVSLELVFWGSEWQTLTSPSSGDIVGAVKKMVQSPYFMGLTQYGFQDIHVRGATTLLSDPPSTFDFSDVGNQAWDRIDGGTFPHPDDEAVVYMFFMPKSASFNDANVRGSHGAPSDFDPPFDLDRAWVGWSSYGSLDYVTDVFSHELVEMITDPEPSSEAWVITRNLNGGNEFGDACNNTVDYLDDVMVQAYWSQAQHACTIPFGPAPTLTGLIPSTGSPFGGTSVVIAGTGFSKRTTVTFAGKPASNVLCLSSTICMATTPPGEGPASVIVTNNHFSTGASRASEFYYQPGIASVTPSTGSVGDRVAVRTIGIYTQTPIITFGTSTVTDMTCNWPVCMVTVPPGAGTVDVHATNNAATTVISPSDKFTYVLPTITSITPSHGPIGGGTYVDIHGTGFDISAATDGQMKAFFNGVPSTYVLCQSSKWCTVRSPAVGSAGAVHVTVSVAGGASAGTSADLFTYTALPWLKSISWVSGGGIVLLDGAAPAAGAVIALASSDPTAVVIPMTITACGGCTSASFTATDIPRTSPESVTLTATYAGTSVSTTSTIQASAPVAISVGLDALALNQSTTATVTLNTPAPPGGAIVAIGSSIVSAIAVPASVVVPAGSHSTTFTITNHYGGAPEVVHITATYAGHSGTALVLVPDVKTCAVKTCAAGWYWNPDDCLCEKGTKQ